MSDQIVAYLRVVSASIKGFQYPSAVIVDNEPNGEVLEVRAVGKWECPTPGQYKPTVSFPVSIHITVPPGHGAIPVIGDSVRVTVGRVTPAGGLCMTGEQAEKFKDVLTEYNREFGAPKDL